MDTKWRALLLSSVMEMLVFSSKTGMASDPGVDGLLQLIAADQTAHIAVRIESPGQEWMSGLRCYMGPSSEIRAVALSLDSDQVGRPVMGVAQTIHSQVLSGTGGWTTVDFAVPQYVGSGDAWVILEVPAISEFQADPDGHGVGYTLTGEPTPVFSRAGAGADWAEIAGVALAVEATWAGGGQAKQSPGGGTQASPAVPPTFMTRFQFSSGGIGSALPALHFELGEPHSVQVSIYNARGRRVRLLGPIQYGAGHQSLTWDARDSSGHPVASGSYYARFASPAVFGTARMVLVR